MNDERRKRISAIISSIEKVRDDLEQAKADLDDIKAEEQDAYDNMPESFQSGERGEKSQAAIDAMDTADSELDNISFDDLLEALETAKE